MLSTSLQQTDPFKKSIAQAQKSVSYTEILEQSMSYWQRFLASASDNDPRRFFFRSVSDGLRCLPFTDYDSPQ